MIGIIRRRLAIRSYHKKLGPYLRKHFGWRVNYTPKEVRSGASALGLSVSDVCYAYAMFCTPSDFATHHASTGEHCDYTTMHAETMSLGTGYQSDGSSSLGHDSGGHHNHHSVPDFGGHDSGGGYDGGDGDGGSSD